MGNCQSFPWRVHWIICSNPFVGGLAIDSSSSLSFSFFQVVIWPVDSDVSSFMFVNIFKGVPLNRDPLFSRLFREPSLLLLSFISSGSILNWLRSELISATLGPCDFTRGLTLDSIVTCFCSSTLIFSIGDESETWPTSFTGSWTFASSFLNSVSFSTASNLFMRLFLVSSLVSGNSSVTFSTASRTSGSTMNEN